MRGVSTERKQIADVSRRHVAWGMPRRPGRRRVSESDVFGQLLERTTKVRKGAAERVVQEEREVEREEEQRVRREGDTSKEISLLTPDVAAWHKMKSEEREAFQSVGSAKSKRVFKIVGVGGVD